MAEATELGKLTSCSTNADVLPPSTFNDIQALANSDADIDDKSIAERAVKDTKEVPSIWFVNFPSKSATSQPKHLAAYMQDIQDYRCWASLVWWRKVFSTGALPQDGSETSIRMRTAYCAKMGIYHMKMTPWLSMTVDHNLSREIECKVVDFHTELLKAVLAGFVGITAANLVALEGILKSLARTISQSTTMSETRTIICERFENVPETDIITSYIRVVSFYVNDSMRNVQNAKKTEQRVKCTIEYNEYEAMFQRKMWERISQQIDGDQKKATDEFLKNQTVDCPPSGV